MGAAMEWSTRIVAHNLTGNTFAPSRALVKKSQINFFRFSSVGVGFFSLSHPISLAHKTVQRVASSKTEVSTGFDSAYAGTQTIEPSKTVHVKFQLQQECLFGEQFLLVGDDPMLGSWNPSNAIPLNWSDGHLWTVELDLPVGRSIQFKYVLKRGTGEILWQPGPDRIFRAWETKSMVTITEDWANAEGQKMTEEEIISPTEKLIHDVGTEYDENLISADTIAYPGDELTVNGSGFTATENKTRGEKGTFVNAKKEVDKADRIGDDKTENIGRNKWKAATSPKKSPRVEPEEPILTYGGGPVLVSGSNPMPVVSANQAPHIES
ncbi:hypothetical protein RHSIM_Rhsim13G0070300 [Rhododendron simsii]|uniref:CBM20 domain-containing protein n=1 Tax=Rhododendron simsii TaxID=118357 RepID=A0A834FY84_RHOSS|nr:hypothetical protein RHSIM_Rhsim13G0070300 [Rhododendron simsii]